MGVVGDTDAGGDRDVVLDRGGSRDVAIRVDPHAVTEDATRLDDGVVRDPAIAADHRVLADDDVAPCPEPISDANPFVHRRAGPDDRVPADLKFT